MAEYSKLYITNNGQALMAKMIAGSGNIDFTKVCSSSTQYTESQLQALTALSNIKQTTLVSKVTRTNEVAIKIDAAYSNVDLKEGYYMRTLGLYAVDPDKGEILYAVCIESQITVICHHITVLRYRLHTYSYIPQWETLTTYHLRSVRVRMQRLVTFRHLKKKLLI